MATDIEYFALALSVYCACCVNIRRGLSTPDAAFNKLFATSLEALSFLKPRSNTLKLLDHGCGSFEPCSNSRSKLGSCAKQTRFDTDPPPVAILGLTCTYSGACHPARREEAQLLPILAANRSHTNAWFYCSSSWRLVLQELHQKTLDREHLI